MDTQNAQPTVGEKTLVSSSAHSETHEKRKPNLKLMIPIVAGIIVLGLIGWLLMPKSNNTANSPSNALPATYKIGIIAPLSGESASDGQLIQRGAEMAKKDFNQEGLTFEFVMKDTLCDPDKAAAAVNELADTEHVVAIIGENCSSATLGAIPAANAKHVVLISPASSSPALTKEGDYFFRTFPSDLLQGVVTAELMRKQNLKRLAIIYSNEAYGSGLNSTIKENFEKLGGTVVASEPFEREAVNFTTQMQKVKAANPDVLYIASNAKHSAAAILLEVKKSGLKVALYGSESVKDQQVLDDVGSIADGMTFTAVTEGTPTFIDKYRAAYGTVPASSNAAQSYDAFMALAKTIQQGATTGEQIKNALPNITFDGMSGQIKFDKAGDLASGNYKIYTVQNGKFVLVDQ